MAETDYTITQRCAFFTPGHNIHFIQARLSWEDPEACVPAEFLGTDGEVIVVRTENGGLRRFRNHDLDRLRKIAHEFGPHIVLGSRGVLRIAHGDSNTSLFCVKPDDGQPLDQCLDPDNVPAPSADRSSEGVAKYFADRILGEGGGMVQL